MKRLNKFLIPVLVIFFFASCNSENGELMGVQGRDDWFEPDPHGMVFIPQGSFQMGPNDQDVPFAINAKPKTVSIDPFWMDITEITNNEYRQFVYWVRDSMAMRLCIKNGMEDFKTKAKEDELDPEFYDHSDPNECHLNWEERDNLWKKGKGSEEVGAAIKDMYYSKQDRTYGEKKIDTRKLVYEYYWVDLNQAAQRTNAYVYDDLGGTGDMPEGHYEGSIIDYDYDNYGISDDFETRDQLVQHAKVPIYPDTLVWMSDYTYSYNEPITRKYFWHPAYDDYPVVGVNWHQANAFSIWRTNIMTNYQISQEKAPYEDYRLPTEAEWEYAARGGLRVSMYPWGGPYTRNNTGCFLANFKPLRGRYGVDLANRTISVGVYEPNEWGLYDMAGNVAEWTSGAFDDASYSFTHDINPDYKYNATIKDKPVKKRKVIRGGSWKDIGYYLQCGTRTYEYQDTMKSYIGFRCVRSYLGREAQGWNTLD